MIDIFSLGCLISAYTISLKARTYLTKVVVKYVNAPFCVPGWCSAQPGLSMRKYTIPFVDLSVGDVCLPPNHPEAVRTPTDLCDRFRRFEFDEQVSNKRAMAL